MNARQLVAPPRVVSLPTGKWALMRGSRVLHIYPRHELLRAQRHARSINHQGRVS